MIQRNKATISKFIIHKVGNKFNAATNVFSEQPVTFDEESYQLMLPFLLKPFASMPENYRFHHHASIDLNEINNYSTQVFSDNELFVEVSKNIVTHLYEQSNSAQIKTGDVIIALFDDIECNGVNTQALGIFKIENKINFFQTYLEDNSFDVFVQKGISTKKLDKGCLIVNTSDADGKMVYSIDNNNYDANYWKHHFLNLTYANDHNRHTKEYITLCKDFSELIKEDFGTQEKSSFLAKTVDYFKENEYVDIEDFTEVVFEENQQQKHHFENYKKEFEQINDTLIRNHFEISDLVVKKEKTKLKTDIKLDTHIQIKIDIDAPDASTEYLEKGYDADKKMKYYKVYYNEETN